jgi:hypothetical protein
LETSIEESKELCPSLVTGSFSYSEFLFQSTFFIFQYLNNVSSFLEFGFGDEFEGFNVMFLVKQVALVTTSFFTSLAEVVDYLFVCLAIIDVPANV